MSCELDEVKVYSKPLTVDMLKLWADVFSLKMEINPGIPHNKKQKN